MIFGEGPGERGQGLDFGRDERPRGRRRLSASHRGPRPGSARRSRRPGVGVVDPQMWMLHRQLLPGGPGGSVTSSRVHHVCFQLTHVAVGPCHVALRALLREPVLGSVPLQTRSEVRVQLDERDRSTALDVNAEVVAHLAGVVLQLESPRIGQDQICARCSRLLDDPAPTLRSSRLNGSVP